MGGSHVAIHDTMITMQPDAVQVKAKLALGRAVAATSNEGRRVHNLDYFCLHKKKGPEKPLQAIKPFLAG